MADAGGGRELLEPRHDAEASREKLVRDLLTGKPAITAMGRSPLLDSVRTFFLTFLSFFLFQHQQIGEGLSSKDGGG